VPSLASSERPILRAMAPVNAPFSMAEEFGLSSSLRGDGGAIQLDEGAFAAARSAGDGPRASSSLPVPVRPQ